VVTVARVLAAIGAPVSDEKAGVTRGFYPLPCKEGTEVTYTTGGAGGANGTGTFVLCWFGVAEVWDVRTSDGQTIHLYPEFGDTIVPLRPVAE
jgi:hypothetical protein